MRKPKILILIDWFLPGTKSGGPVRSYANLIEHLAKDFEFYIITRNTDFGSKIPYSHVEANTWISINDCTSVYYISANQLNRKHLRKIIKSVDYDVAMINGIYSYFFSILPIFILSHNNRPIIISARGMLNPQAFSVKGFRKKLFLKIAKLLGLYKGISFHATNENEANHIKRLIGDHTNIQVAPNLSRVNKFKEAEVKTLGEPRRFINVARVSIEKGTLNMLRALKQIKYPLILDIFGPIHDQHYWSKCKAVIDELPSSIKVNYRGVVDGDTIPNLLRAYDFFVLLSEGENFGHAILEAFTAGCPVIISDRTPWKNLEEHEVGWDVPLEQSNAAISALIMALEMNQLKYDTMSNSAIEYAKEIINDPKVLEQNKALFLNAIK